ncbi:hypothetical protein D3875_11145 [Deinococcus cavernae]|uniref:Peptidase C-terminal archaeal/bacterial domain-containing protein n=1 Tax=Deinococcus cavernae TaxID=2320857 RepID=A0A418VCD6_9DEIO|nr:hypothetical protein D3875_11145 [Deinococcus cavernae]
MFGVVSWGIANVCTKATAFARVGEYQPWITSVTGVQAQSGGTTGPVPAKTTTYTGSVGSAASSYKPGTGGFSYAGGTLKASLSGPSGTDFDLFLQKLSSTGTWTDVASSETSTSTESINYAAGSGTYRWEVYAYSGSGSYTLTETK